MNSLPSFPGKTRLADAVGKMCGHWGDGRASIRLSRHAGFVVDLRDRVQRQMWAGCYEPHLRKCLESLLREGDVFLDVGAHIGYFSVIAGNIVGPSGQVFAFEADPGISELLACNIAEMPWVQAFHNAVWKENGVLMFERSSSAGESGWGTLTAIRDLGQGQHVKVNAIALDEWVLRASVSCVQGIKIDAEGSELAILSGAQRTLARFRPFLLVEMNDALLRQAGTSAIELAAKIREYSYDIFGLTWMQVRHVVAGSPLPTFEVLCVPSELTEGTLRTLRNAAFTIC